MNIRDSVPERGVAPDRVPAASVAADVAAVIAAAGQGKRMGGGTPKQFLPLKGKPVLAWTLLAFQKVSEIRSIVLVCPEGDEDFCQREIVRPYGLDKVHRILPGGQERQESVYRGLRAVDSGCGLVAIHDGARPLVTAALISRTVAEARRHGAAVVAVPVKDTVKIAGASEMISETPDRRTLWAAQTPQVFLRELALSAHRRALEEGFLGTDDSALVERLGHPVKLVIGEPENLKITAPLDLLVAEAILEKRLGPGATTDGAR